MNDLIRTVAAAGLSGAVYYAFHVLGFVTIFVFNGFYGKKYKIPPWKSIALTIITYLIAYIWVYILAWIENSFTNWGANNIVRAFVWFPLIALLPVHFLKLDRKKAIDMVAPSAALVQAVSHIGCIFSGCCRGYPMNPGIYNPVVDTTLFPIQLVECAVALIVALCCIFYAWRNDFDGSGKVYPIFLILFGITRFGLEFLRENDKIVGNLSVLAVHAAIMVIVGIIWMIILHIKKRQWTRDEDCIKCS